MEYVNLGRSGLKVSRICLGMMTYGTPAWREWVLDEDQSRPIIRRALEMGINFFDTADVYSLGVSEEVTGRALRDFSRRDEVVLATKVYFAIGQGPNGRGLSRKHIMDAIDGSLQRLGTDYVDLYQIHRWDNETPIEETMEALHDVVKAGKARYIGASSMYAWQFAKAQIAADAHGWTRFVSMQNHYNLIYREEEREMIPFCVDQGVGIIPWSPLARGFLAGTRSRETKGETLRAQTDTYAHSMYYRDNDYEVVERLIELAERRPDAKPAQLALAWLMHRPGITAPIIGASKMGHLEDAVAAAEMKLSDEEMRLLEEVYQPHPILGHS
ncbi:MAG: aldo/keto reductase [Anaerolineae bacterium]|nr:aldo/keto reductase [Anaerolineae bacterium]RIK23994.1 MAG: aldo/keto reductase [Anaerolineae bacterium]